MPATIHDVAWLETVPPSSVTVFRTAFRSILNGGWTLNGHTTATDDANVNALVTFVDGGVLRCYLLDAGGNPFVGVDWSSKNDAVIFRVGECSTDSFATSKILASTLSQPCLLEDSDGLGNCSCVKCLNRAVATLKGKPVGTSSPVGYTIGASYVHACENHISLVNNFNGFVCNNHSCGRPVVSTTESFHFDQPVQIAGSLVRRYRENLPPWVIFNAADYLKFFVLVLALLPIANGSAVSHEPSFPHTCPAPEKVPFSFRYFVAESIPSQGLFEHFKWFLGSSTLSQPLPGPLMPLCDFLNRYFFFAEYKCDSYLCVVLMLLILMTVVFGVVLMTFLTLLVVSKIRSYFNPKSPPTAWNVECADRLAEMVSEYWEPISIISRTSPSPIEASDYLCMTMFHGECGKWDATLDILHIMKWRKRLEDSDPELLWDVLFSLITTCGGMGLCRPLNDAARLFIENHVLSLGARFEPNFCIALISMLPFYEYENNPNEKKGKNKRGRGAYKVRANIAKKRSLYETLGKGQFYNILDDIRNVDWAEAAKTFKERTGRNWVRIEDDEIWDDENHVAVPRSSERGKAIYSKRPRRGLVYIPDPDDPSFKTAVRPSLPDREKTGRFSEYAEHARKSSINWAEDEALSSFSDFKSEVPRETTRVRNGPGLLSRILNFNPFSIIFPNPDDFDYDSDNDVVVLIDKDEDLDAEFHDCGDMDQDSEESEPVPPIVIDPSPSSSSPSAPAQPVVPAQTDSAPTSADPAPRALVPPDQIASQFSAALAQIVEDQRRFVDLAVQKVSENESKFEKPKPQRKFCNIIDPATQLRCGLDKNTSHTCVFDDAHLCTKLSPDTAMRCALVKGHKGKCSYPVPTNKKGTHGPRTVCPHTRKIDDGIVGCSLVDGHDTVGFKQCKFNVKVTPVSKDKAPAHLQNEVKSPVSSPIQSSNYWRVGGYIGGDQFFSLTVTTGKPKFISPELYTQHPYQTWWWMPSHVTASTLSKSTIKLVVPSGETHDVCSGDALLSSAFEVPGCDLVFGNGATLRPVLDKFKLEVPSWKSVPARYGEPVIINRPQPNIGAVLQGYTDAEKQVLVVQASYTSVKGDSGSPIFSSLTGTEVSGIHLGGWENTSSNRFAIPSDVREAQPFRL